MGTKGTIRFQEKEGDLPGWQVYTELFEPADVVYLEVEGIQADVTMIGSPWGHAAGTVLLRLPAATARQLGLVPPDWKNDASGSKVDSVNYDDRLRDNYDVRSTGVIVAVSWL